MSQDDKAAQTRKSIVESVKGKAKELAGAVTGNDSLTAEGQLEQAEAKERREASRMEAVAEAVAEVVRIAGVGDDLPRCGVDVLEGDAGRQRLAPRPLRVGDQ